MKERPILMNAESVRGILGGRKKQTRRVVKPNFCMSTVIYQGRSGSMKKTLAERCPYGKEGDRLWVRETFAEKRFVGVQKFFEGCLLYRADGKEQNQVRWKPSIFMPRWASRILLEITDIRVERLQDISKEDVILEGCKGLSGEPRKNLLPVHQIVFADLWDSINAKRDYDWDSDPFVWVLSFVKIEEEKGGK